MPNVDLLVETLAHIEVEQGHWNQEHWGHAPISDELFLELKGREEWDVDGYTLVHEDEVTPCGTAYCLAGWACVLSGEKLQWKLHPERYVYADRTVAGVKIPERANELLGLSRDRNVGYSAVGDLFSPNRTIDQLYELGSEQFDIEEDALRQRVEVRTVDLQRHFAELATADAV